VTARSYVSPTRAAAAARKRSEVIRAAIGFLREEHGVASFSLDAIARSAGVTRLTVYNQFGSRRGLLEAVFDDIARRGRLDRLKDAHANPDVCAGLRDFVAIFCDFWSSDPAIARLHDAMAIDPEFASALGERHERRRRSIEAFVQRLGDGSALPAARRDTVDVIFALTSHAMFHMLATARSSAATRRLIQDAVDAVVSDRLSRGRTTTPPGMPS